MSDCSHSEIADPPEGKVLRICLVCVKRLIECSFCDAKITAGHEGFHRWRNGGVIDAGEIVSEWRCCPDCPEPGPPEKPYWQRLQEGVWSG